MPNTTTAKRCVVPLVAAVVFATSCWSHPSQAQWSSRSWIVQCDPSQREQLSRTGDCDSSQPTGATSFVRSELERGSAWLDGLGFLPPRVRQDPTLSAYMAVVYAGAGARNCYRGHCTDWGFYDHRERLLAVSADTNVGFDGDEAIFATAMHELIHAVQRSYPAFSGGLVSRWIEEGTAEALGHVWLRETGRTPSWGGTFRSYSLPLHLPEDVRGKTPPNARQNPYLTEHLWTWVGSRYGNRSMAYLTEVFAQDLSGSGVEGVDTAFRQLGFGSLREVYAGFVVHMGTQQTALAGGVFDPCGELTLDTSQPEASHSGEVLEIATVCHRLKVRSDPHEPRWVQVRLRAADPARGEDLQLGAEHRLRADRFFRKRLPAGHSGEFLLQAINVSHAAAKSTALGYTIEACLTDAPVPDCEPSVWSAVISGPTLGQLALRGDHGEYQRVDGNIGFPSSLTLPDQQPPGPPWLSLRLATHPSWEMDFNPEGGAEIQLHLPHMAPGNVGSVHQLPVLLRLSSHPGKTFSSNTVFMHDRVGDGFARGWLRTGSATITHHDEDWIEGSFDARVLSPGDVEPGMWQGPGTVTFPEAETRVTGRFRVSTRSQRLDMAEIGAAAESMSSHLGIDLGIDADALHSVMEIAQQIIDGSPEAFPSANAGDNRRPPSPPPPPDRGKADVEILASGFVDLVAVAVGPGGEIRMVDGKDGGRILTLLPGGGVRTPFTRQTLGAQPHGISADGGDWLVASGPRLVGLTGTGVSTLGSAPAGLHWWSALRESPSQVLVAGPAGLARLTQGGGYEIILSTQDLLASGVGYPVGIVRDQGSTVFADVVGNVVRIDHERPVVLASGLGMLQAIDADTRGYLIAALSGEVYRVSRDGTVSQLAQGLGMLTGVASTPEGILVTDRLQGRVMRLREP